MSSVRKYAGPAKPHPLEIRWREPEPGYWLLYARKGARRVPARIFIRPMWLAKLVGFMKQEGRRYPELDSWVVSHLAGEIAGRWIDDVADIWTRVLLGEQKPGHWSCAYPLVPKDGLTVEEEYLYQMSVLEYEKKRGDSPAQPITKLRELSLPF